MSTEEQILENRFVELLRNELQIDHGSFVRLCQHLRVLAVEWRGKAMVNKVVVQELYVLPTIAKRTADLLRRDCAERATELDEMAATLDALILECFA